MSKLYQISFNPEDQFLTTDRNENWFKISVWPLSPFRCDLRPTQYGSGVKNWTNYVVRMHSLNFKELF